MYTVKLKKKNLNLFPSEIEKIKDVFYLNLTSHWAVFKLISSLKYHIDQLISESLVYKPR